MPRAGDQFPQRRGGNDLRWPTRGLLDYTQPLNDTAVQAGQRITNQIGAAAQQGGQNASNTTITNILQQLGIESVIGDSATTQLGDYLAQLLTPNSALNAANLWGLLPPGTLGPVPATSLTAQSVNPLWNANFEGAVSLGQADGWVWDAAVYYPAPGPPPFYPVGSARNTADGRTHALKSNPFAVTAGQTVAFTVPVLATNLVATGDPIQLSVLTYLDDAPVSAQTLEVLPAPAGPTTGWVAPPAGSYGDVLAGSYVAPDDHTVNKILMRLVLDATATAGVVRYGAVGVTVTGGVIASLQDGIDQLNSDNTAATAATATFQTAVRNAVLDHAGDWPAMYAAISSAYTTWATTTSDLGADEIATLDQVIGSILGFSTSTGKQPATNVMPVLGGGSLGDDVQAILDNIANALGHAGTGHTLAQIETYLGIVPTNATAISTNQSWLTQISQIVNGQSVVPLNTSVTQFQTWWNSITGGGTPGSVAATAIAGTLPPTQVTGFSGNNLTASFDAMFDKFTSSFNQLLTTGTTLNDAAASAQSVSQTASQANGLANTHDDVLSNSAVNVGIAAALSATFHLSDLPHGTALPTVAIGGSAIGGFIQAGLIASQGLGYLAFMASAPSTPTGVYVNIRTMDPITGLQTNRFNSNDISAMIPTTSLPGWVTINISPKITGLNPTDLLCVEIVSVNNTVNVVAKQHNVPNLTGIVPPNMAFTRTVPAGQQSPQSITQNNLQFGPTTPIPWIGVGVSGVAVTTRHDPEIWYSFTAGTYTYNFPSWFRAGVDLLDVVVCGGGGGGSGAGNWVPAGPGGSSHATVGATTVTGNGGAPGTVTTGGGDGIGPGDYSFQSTIYHGGAGGYLQSGAPYVEVDGTAPGGAGAGAEEFNIRSQAGFPGTWASQRFIPASTSAIPVTVGVGGFAGQGNGSGGVPYGSAGGAGGVFMRAIQAGT